MAELRRQARLPLWVGLLTLCVTIFISSCGGRSPTSPGSVGTPGGDPSSPSPRGSGIATLSGAGDIARCGADLVNAEATSRLLDGLDGTIFTAGDNTQTAGTPEEFRDCYGPTWGRHLARTRPAMGNHDFATADGAAYYQYFGANAGPAGLGYYSYDLAAWHIVVLNSNLPVSATSAQIAWLRRDLQTTQNPCTLAYWHHPFVSSGPNGNTSRMRDAWAVLYEHGVELVMNGHDHQYERFAPQDPDLRPDPERGIREFIVGTGGCFLYKAEHRQPNSEVQASVHGVLKLTLRENGYDWQFIPVAGGRFADAGSGACH